MRTEAPPRRRFHLHVVIGLLSALFVLPALGVQYWIYEREEREALETERRRTLTRGRTIAALVDQEFESSVRTLMSIAGRPTLRRAWEIRDLPGLDRHLEEARALAPEFLFVALHDLSGTVHRVMPPDPIVGTNFAYRDWYRGVRASGLPYVSEVYRTRMLPQRLVVGVAAPLRDGTDRPSGILMAAISLEGLKQRIENTQRSVVGEPIVVDQRGHIVVAPSFTQGSDPMPARDPDVVAEGLAGREAARQIGSGAKGYLVSVTPIPSLGWAVLYRRSNSTSFAGLYRLRGEMVAATLYLGLIFLATAGVAFHLVRRQAVLDQAVRQSEERYRLFFDSSPLPVWLFDLETRRFLAVNEAATRRYGYSREEFLAMTVADIRPAEDVPLLLERLAATNAVQGGETWKHKTRDGTVIDVEIFSHRLTFAGRAASLVMVNDVSELRRHREDLQTLLDSMSTMVATVAPGGRFLMVNRAAEIASGLAHAELMETNFLEGRWWTFDACVQERVSQAFRRACQGSPLSYEEQVSIAGKVVSISFSLSPIRGADGRVAHVVVEGLDVTPLKAAEASLRHRSRELEALNHELEAFTYSVSHDLRAPLRAVAGFARILEEDHAAQLDPDGKSHLRRIASGARQMGMLIDDLLNLSRIGRTQIERQPTDLAALVEDVRRKVALEAGERRIQWRLEALPTVLCDARLLRQVFVNLLSNAVKYTRPRERAQIAIEGELRNGETVLVVRDNGVGFDMKYVHKLFGVFQRLHDSEAFEGTGVGLATVQRIVHRHGGRIWAEAAVDQGATFYFTLEPARAGAGLPSSASGEPGGEP